MTVNECCDLWLISKRFKSSTYSTYKYKVESQIIPKLGHYELLELNQDTIDDYINKLLTEGRKDGKGGLSVKTVSNIIAILSPILEMQGKTYKYKVSPIKRKEAKVFQKVEYQKFLNYLYLDTNLEKLGLLLSLFCGIRIGELAGLKWQFIDLSNGIIRIEKTLQRIKNPDITAKNKTVVIWDSPKSDSSVRNIPIQDFLLEKLKKYETKSDYFFLTGSRKFIEPRTIENHFNKHLKNCGIKKINFHATRHTFASHCIELGIDIKTVSEILGHSDIAFTMKTYVHVSLEHKKKQLEKLSIAYK